MTTAEVDAAVALGATSVKEVRQQTGAGASCGSCVKRLSCLLAAARVADSAPVESMPEAERLVLDSVPDGVPDVPEHAPYCPAAVPSLG